MQIVVDLSESQVEGLLLYAKNAGLSCNEAVREAVASQIALKRKPLSSYIGLWARTNPDGIEDGLAYQERLRAEW